MATSPSRVAWDSCTWIAHIQRERILGPDGNTVMEDRGAMCRPVLDAAERGVIEIVVSQQSRWLKFSLAIAQAELMTRESAIFSITIITYWLTSISILGTLHED